MKGGRKLVNQERGVEEKLKLSLRGEEKLERSESRNEKRK